jgi:pimeloyl-ACP methyl ester carboxylesterase
MKRGYASIKSGQVHYYEAGQGTPLLLLHSAPRSARAYRVLLPLLAQNFHCIAADLPGFGNSDPLHGEVTMEAFGAAMAEFLKALGIPKAHVFGYHTGNKVAAAMGAAQPQSIDRLILCGQIHSIIPDKDARNTAIHHIVDKYFTKYPDPLRKWSAQWTDVAAFALPRDVFAKKDVTEQDIAEFKTRVLDHVQALSAIEATYGANFHFDFGGALRRIEARTLLLELVMPDEEHYGRQLHAVCALLRNGRGETVMNAGRVAIESHATEIARSTTAFLNETS